ncbi:ABC-type transport auxiliary lipoprotein family protein [Marinobacter lacisalsi]|uniref:ABC-type transport auxiliary lipoprotein family protein n=1 Tax=Marinobacter lacisalsi TaxID=475979 RepID=A0ABV8QF32_9GAMM
MSRFRQCHSLRILTAGLLMLTVSGCSVALLPEKQSLRIFTLPYGYTPDADEIAHPGKGPVLKVAQPQASGVLDTKRIVIEVRPNELAAISAARWTTNAPSLLRDHLVRSLREDPRIATVVSDTSGSGSDITLTSELRAFQEVRTSEPPEIQLYLQAQLVENGSRQILATRDFNVTVPSAGEGLDDSVAAFGAAADSLAAEMADWIGSELADY